MADIWDNLLMAVFTLHLFICPFTKVEESFNIQAMHDFLYHGTDFSKYDHLEFPGVVPRTFLGPLLVSFVSYPVVMFARLAGASKLFSQFVVRFCLGSICLFAFSKFRSSVSHRFGSDVGRFMAAITATQFHFLFYVSRPLPNTFALVLGELLFNYLSALTISVDSIFWKRYLWPEGEVLWYNTVQNKSSNWGTSPFLWYFYSVLPRCLLFAIALVPLGLWRDRRTWTLAAPSIGFVFLYSFLPHKELRFIIYVIPVFNAVAACGMSFIYKNEGKWRPFVSSAVKVATIGGLLANAVVTALLLLISCHNYPGGVALQRLHSLLHNQTTEPCQVHISVAAAQTGVTRFGELDSTWR
ncbi:PREDICTED: dol-P-Man:Man(7)GlcNAc(2)-PP-Dol alpha-1,6-mannosyltransferase-like [Acropora digitifera]|uniref:dol-P-Man:Man(7)GlcNAc(2)-PP-Dol alpha-1,6-mannosyltransferase-like n=1 Tax=Acropora digitifera TaxID=70779 RepID=UPI00077A7607|nr:PREDICTED: dol-P-Man:Man(7)GlcNAc(2)-PP-Dol alpha-1,6-mannosyltransferase-like [Acropora digitifera]